MHKSSIKVYEYAALGLPAIASAVVPYCDVIEDGKTGLLARNSAAEWSKSLLLLCESEGLLQRLSAEIESRRHQWTLGHNAARLCAAWTQALFGAPSAHSVPALENAHHASQGLR